MTRTAPFSPARIAGLIAMLAFLLPAGIAAQSQWEVPRGDGEAWSMPPEATRAIGKIKSPYCPGQMLEVCPSPSGAALRDSIADLAEQGWDADRIVEWVVGRHGEEYRAVPPKTAGGFVAWTMPAFGAVMLFLGTLWLLQRMRGQPKPLAAPVGATVSEEEEARLRAAMRELDAEEEATFF